MSGAHITSEITPLSNNINTDQASIFEVIAQESLTTGLSSAFHHLIQVIASSNPRKYGWLVEWFHELYLVFDSIVQLSHLKAYNASFAEKFYGLRRIPCDGSASSSSPSSSSSSSPMKSDGTNLGNSSVLKSLIFLTLAPYLKKRLDAKYSDLRREFVEQRDRNENRSLEQLFLDFYPLINAAMESMNLMLQVMFTVGNSQYHSLSYQVISMKLITYSKPSESEQEENPDSLAGRSWMAAKWIARFLGTSLSLGAFFIQFLDYYYSRESSLTKSFTTKGPPPPANSLYSRVKAGRATDHCYLCSEKRRNDTVLSSSGFVFCYSCIRAFVIRNKKCPATGFPATLDQLIKLYPPQSN